MIALCTNNKDAEKMLTVGKTYEVAPATVYNGELTQYIKVLIDDEGEEFTAFKHRFKGV